MIDIKELVCSGGGTKGFAYIGVLGALQEYKININKISCVSVGSIFGLLYSIGYTYDELKDELLSLNIPKLVKLKLSKLIGRFGVDSGKRITMWLESMIEKKGYSKSLTFKELYKKSKIDYKVYVTNLNKNELEYFNHETTPNLSIVRAIRMAISVPLVFSVKKYKKNVYVDAAILDNFPIHMCKDKSRVLGIHLRSIEQSCMEINTLDAYIQSVMRCIIVKMENNTKYESFKDQTVSILAGNIHDNFNFDMSENEKIEIINSGYTSVLEYLKTKNKNCG